MDPSSFGLLIGLAFVTWLIYYWRRKPRIFDMTTGIPLPHPFQLPLVGCIPFIHREGIHYSFTDWTKRFGKLFQCQIGPQSAVVIGDVKLLQEAFNKSTFSGRPPLSAFYMGYTPKDPDTKGILLNEGQAWKDQRRFLMSSFKDFGIGKTSFQDVINEKCDEMVHALDSQQGRPVDVRMMLNTTVSDVISTVLFGQNYKHATADFKKYSDHLFNATEDVSRAAPLVPWPWLRHFPYFSKIYRRLARGWDFSFGLLKDIIANVEKNNPENEVTSFIAAYHARQKEPSAGSFTDENLLLTLSDVFGAGFETTASTLRWALLYMCRCPEVQEKLQTEIDREIGRERNPQASDKERLLWIEATILEVQRIVSVLPNPVPHRTTEDSELAGYFIPRDTIVSANLYYIHHDPVNFPNPDQFQPERFLNADRSRIVNTECLVPFSIGKRSCPGEGLAKVELFLIFTRLLQKFRFEFALEATVDMRPRGGITIDTRPFLICAHSRDD